MNKYLRQDLRGFEPYREHIVPCQIKLNANESPFPMPKGVKDRLINWLIHEENLNRYPDSDSSELRSAIAMLWGVMPDNVICGVGSDQIIDFITKAMLEPGEVVVTASPTFSMYAVTSRLNRGKVVTVPLEHGCNLNADKIINAVRTNQAKIVFLCTPNNPDGGVISVEDSLKVAAETDAVVVIDEAYGEFGGESAAKYINQYKNIIILRTFSKVYGLAGARVGYMLACSSMTDAVLTVKPPYNLPVLSQLVALAALEESPAYLERATFLNGERKRLNTSINKLNGITAYKSEANFILLETKLPLDQLLHERGILVRRLKDNGENRLIRVTVGNSEENNALIKALGEIVDATGNS